MMRKIFSLFALSISLQLFSADIKSIDIVTDEWENCTNKDGTGLYIDILKEVFQPEGITVNVKFEPYSKAIETLSKGKADLTIGTYKDEVENAVYPKWHFGADDVVACFMKGKIKNWAGEKSLEGKKVVWMREYDYNEYISVKMEELENVDKRESGINLILKDRADFFLDNQTDLLKTIKSMNLDITKFEIKLVKYIDLYMCFANNDRGKQLASIWDKNFQKLLNSGKIKELFKKWGMLFTYNF
jgi:polar amino acid transport system substrate-binding protein